MHREGHIGLGFLIYAPFAFAMAYHELYATFVLGCITVQYWSHFPDIDQVLPFVTHRGITHTLLVAVVAGVVTATAAVGLLITDVLPATLFASDAVDVSPPLLLGGFGFLLGFLGVAGHILGDLFTPMGVKPAAPFSDAEFTLDMFKASNRKINRTFGKAGIYALGAALVLGVLSNTGTLQELYSLIGV